MTDEVPELTQVEKLVALGSTLANQINTQLFHVKEFKKWSDGKMVLAAICFAAGAAKVADMSHEDYILLCETAYKGINAEHKSNLVIP